MEIDKHKVWLVVGIVIVLLAVGIILAYSTLIAPIKSKTGFAGKAYSSTCTLEPQAKLFYNSNSDSFDANNPAILKDWSTYGINGNLGVYHTSSAEPEHNAWMAGKVGGALRFGGANDVNGGNKVLIKNNNWMNFAEDTGFSVALWVNQDGSSNTQYALARYNLNQAGFGLGKADNVFFAYVADGSGIVAQGPVDASFSPNTWAHYTLVYTSASKMAQLYKNGEKISEVEISGGFKDWNGNLFVGALNSQEYPWSGAIDGVKLWNRPISAEEIKSIYVNENNGVSGVGDPDGLLLRMELDEAEGNIASDGSGSSLLGEFVMDGDVGGTVTDSSGHGNDGAVIGATWNPTGGHDGKGAYKFDGADDWINFGTNNIFKPTKSFSVSVWIKANTLEDYNMILGNTNYNSLTKGFSLYSHSGRLVFHVNNYGSNKAQKTFTDTIGWHQVVGTYDQQMLRIYVDGVEGTPDFLSEEVDYTGAAGFIVGSTSNYADQYKFNGHIDDVRMYDFALSPAQVVELYQTGDNPSGSTSSHYGDLINFHRPLLAADGLACEGDGDYFTTGKSRQSIYGSGEVVASVTFTPQGPTTTCDKLYLCQPIMGDTAGSFEIVRGNYGGNDKIWYYYYHTGKSEPYISEGFDYEVGKEYTVTLVKDSTQMCMYNGNSLVSCKDAGEPQGMSGIVQYCKGWVSNPVSFNGIIKRAVFLPTKDFTSDDITGLIAGKDFTYYPCPATAEVCNNNIDDDLDGNADCQDLDCNGKTNANSFSCCQQESECSQIGMSCDTNYKQCVLLGTACGDSGCKSFKENDCADAKDNDYDDSADCADADCTGDAVCASAGESYDLRIDEVGTGDNVVESSYLTNFDICTSNDETSPLSTPFSVTVISYTPNGEMKGTSTFTVSDMVIPAGGACEDIGSFFGSVLVDSVSLAQGKVNLKVELDVNGEVKELNEGNNVWTGEVYFTPVVIPAVAPCGNSALDSGEECDDGNALSGDGCSAECKVVCYDSDNPEGKTSIKDYVKTKGTVMGIDKNTGKFATASDYCLEDAPYEYGCLSDGKKFSKSLLECSGGTTCQNGACVTPVATTESSCSDGADNDGDSLIDCGDTDCAGQLNAQGKTCCLSDATCTQTGETCDLSTNICGVKVVPVMAVCGNGVMEGTETCDDGNTLGGDGCSKDCAVGCNDPDQTYATQPYPNYMQNPFQKSSLSTSTMVSGVKSGDTAVTEHSDVCSDEATVTESFCVGGTSYSWNSFKCANYLPGTICKEGACIVSTPSKELNCGDSTDDDVDGLMDCADVEDCPNKQASCGMGKYCSDTKCIFNVVEGNYDAKSVVNKEDVAVIKSNPTGFWNYVGKSVQKLNQYVKKMADNWKK